MSELRRRLVPASEPDGEPACRLTAAEGKAREAEMNALFSRLTEQRQTDEGGEFVFADEPAELWGRVSSYVDEEAVCCPFYTFEQEERPDGVVLRVRLGTPA